VDPLIGFALDHAEQPSLDDLERVGFEIGQEEEQSVFWRRQRAVFVDGKAARSPRFPIHPPRGHTGLERGLEGRDQELKLLERQAGEIQQLRRAGLQVNVPYTSQRTCLL